MTPREAIAILDFGGQYSHLIARRVRDNHVYCELLPPNATVADSRKLNARGIILSGGPASTYEKEAPNVDPALLSRAPASFDGESDAVRFARRARNWIGRVEFVHGS